MECNVYLGGPSQFELQGAILVYTGGNAAGGAFAAWHEIESDKTRAPRLGPAKPLSTFFLKELSRGLGAMMRPEILPENVLVRTPDILVWWRPAQRRKMFFRHEDELGVVNGRLFPQPALVYRASHRELWIRALADDVRPSATTTLRVAPYSLETYNTSASPAKTRHTRGCHRLRRQRQRYGDGPSIHPPGLASGRPSWRTACDSDRWRRSVTVELCASTFRSIRNRPKQERCTHLAHQSVLGSSMESHPGGRIQVTKG